MPKYTTRSTIKRCTNPECGFQCDYALAAEFFYTMKRAHDGFQSRCMKCQSSYRKNHAEDKRIVQRAYLATHQQEYVAYREAHKMEARQRAKEYRITHLDQCLAKDKLYRETHQLEIRAYRQRPEAKLLHRLNEQRRRARSYLAGPDLTRDEVQQVLKAHTNPKTGKLICAFCGKPIRGAYHLDHWIPLILGGSNEVGNFRVMHPKCNQRKAFTHPHKTGRLI